MNRPTISVNRQTLRIGQHQAAVDARLRQWKEEKFIRRMWAKDTTLWSAEPVPELSDRLGWLSLPERMHEEIDGLRAFADEVREEGFRHVVLLGMGGSSLAPEVFQRTFGNAPGYPRLTVLDSTHPRAVTSVAETINLPKTLFVVSSKSGTTTETLSGFRYFWDLLTRSGFPPARQFIAITDPGTWLEKAARNRGFRHIFHATPDVGGRYSALTVFGLVPAALIGVDLHKLVHHAWTIAKGCAFFVPEEQNSALVLGAALGELAIAGRDKVTFVTTPSLGGFPMWAEQLIAESTGKDGKGIVPVADEPRGPVNTYGNDRVFVRLVVEGEENRIDSRKLDALVAAGHPVVDILLPELAAIGQEIFKWEMAVASASAVLGIHPFNQPDVELAKQLAREAMAADGQPKRASSESAVNVTARKRLAHQLEALLAQVRQGDYVGLQAYLPQEADVTSLLGALRVLVRNRTKAATTLGFGPRFLHSTGQLQKGGPNTGVFLQLVDEPTTDVEVPEAGYTFVELLRAQALGEFKALRQGKRRVLRISLGKDAASGLQKLLAAMPGA